MANLDLSTWTTTTTTKWLARTALAGALTLGMALALGCDSDTNGPTGCDKPADCTKFGTVGAEGSFGTHLCNISNSQFCSNTEAGNCNDLNANAAVEVCGVGVGEPAVGGTVVELERSNDVKEYAGSGPPDLACWKESSFPAPPDMSQSVKMAGIAKIFKNGCESDGVNIEVYTVVRDGSDNDGMPDQMVGSLTTPSVCDMTNATFEDIEDCADGRWECNFEIDGIPTETELLIVTSGTKWRTIYEYNVFFRNAEVDAMGTVIKDVRALVTDDYPVIAQAAIGRPITTGRGAVAGEVHDCGDVRLKGAVVDIDASRAELTYFGDDEDDPLPDLSARHTGRTALYSALDVPPGPVTVVAAGVAGGELLGIGYYEVRAFPDAVTSITFRGLRPFQLPGQ